MTILSRDDELHAYAPDTWEFWRNLAVYFCAFSVIGHWLEIVYCSFMDFTFDIVADDMLVWDDPMYPFLIYGIGTAVCAILLEPLKERLIERHSKLWHAALHFYIVTVLVCMFMELAMGFTLNRPVDGVYPLWDNSQMPLNILGQAWLVNDIALGAIAMLYTWVIYPLCQKGIHHIPPRIANVASVVIVIAFIVLCVVKFS